MTESTFKAFEFFARYGNISSEAIIIANTTPTISQLKEAFSQCIKNSGDTNKSIQAASLVCKHHDLDFIELLECTKYRNGVEVLDMLELNKESSNE